MNTPLHLDQHGHLADFADWNRAVAEQLAAEDGICLTAEHWQLITAVQDIYQQTGDTPPMRLLIKLLRERVNPQLDSLFLYRLYPEHPVRFASRHAGLPKPKHCM